MFVYGSLEESHKAQAGLQLVIFLPWFPVQLGLQACTTKSSYRAFLTFIIFVWSFLTYADTMRKMAFVESFQTDFQSRKKPCCFPCDIPCSLLPCLRISAITHHDIDCQAKAHAGSPVPLANNSFNREDVMGSRQQRGGEGCFVDWGIFLQDLLPLESLIWTQYSEL